MRSPPHVIFILTDTLRHDYAEKLRKTLSREGFVEHEYAVTPSPWTVPAHASIFTGEYPIIHGVHETKTRKGFDVKFKRRNLLIDELARLGYTSHLISANAFIRPELGFNEFDRFWDIYPKRPISLLSKEEESYLESILGISGHRNTLLVKKLLSEGKFRLLMKLPLHYPLNRLHAIYKSKLQNWPINKGSKKAVKILEHLQFKKPQFIFMNLMEVHLPLFSGKQIPFVENFKNNELDTAVLSKWRSSYYRASEYLAGNIERMLEVLKEKGVFESSLIIVCSDHGELIGEHGKVQHGTFLYDELLRVPLFIRYPTGHDRFPLPPSDEPLSLTVLPSLILSVATNRKEPGTTFQRAVFSESYGVHVEVNTSTLSREELKTYLNFEKYRIAVYYRNFKGIFNVTDWKFESVSSNDSETEVDGEVVKILKNEIVRFLKTATIAKFPKPRLNDL